MLLLSWHVSKHHHVDPIATIDEAYKFARVEKHKPKYSQREQKKRAL